MKFYVIERPYDRDRDLVAVTNFIPVTHKMGNAPRCPACGGFIGALPWLPPFRGEIEVLTRQFGDVAFGATSDGLVVSERFTELYRKAGLVGLGEFQPVEITRVKRILGRGAPLPPRPNYFYTTIVRGRAAVDIRRSHMTFAGGRFPACDECRIGSSCETASAIVIENGTWAGEDIFYPRSGLAAIMLSERAKEWWEANEINNGIVIPASKFRCDWIENPSGIGSYWRSWLAPGTGSDSA